MRYFLHTGFLGGLQETHEGGGCHGWNTGEEFYNEHEDERTDYELSPLHGTHGSASIPGVFEWNQQAVRRRLPVRQLRGGRRWSRLTKQDKTRSCAIANYTAVEAEAGGVEQRSH